METLLTGTELIKAVKGTQIGNAICSFIDVQTDSRNVLSEKRCMFVPLIGEFQNGHKYIPDVLDKNVGVVLINNSEYEQNLSFYNDLALNNPKVCFVCVENTLHALQDAAEAYVNKVASKMIRVSITGSSGKTTTKEMLVSVSKKHFGENAVAYTKGNLNSETGLPLSIFQIRGDEKIGIFEMGMNRENEIGEISKVWKSQYGIITNIGTAHIGILGSQQNIANEKRKSFDYISKDGVAFVYHKDSYADYCTENVKGKIVKIGSELFDKKYGVKYIENKGLFGTLLSVDGLKICVPLAGEYNYLNALSVIACAKELGISAQEIKNGLEEVTSVAGRMETKTLVLKNRKSVILIKDCYNANLDSMTKVIDFCESIKQIGKKIFVLADMKELGEESKNAHEKIGQKINTVLPDYVFLIGGEMKYAYDILESKDNAHWFSSSCVDTLKEISKEINEQADENDIILLKGSHSMGLEKLVPLLQSN